MSAIITKLLARSNPACGCSTLASQAIGQRVSCLTTRLQSALPETKEIVRRTLNREFTAKQVAVGLGIGAFNFLFYAAVGRLVGNSLAAFRA